MSVAVKDFMCALQRAARGAHSLRYFLNVGLVCPPIPDPRRPGVFLLKNKDGYSMTFRLWAHGDDPSKWTVTRLRDGRHRDGDE
jgi:hypothetical protein